MVVVNQDPNDRATRAAAKMLADTKIARTALSSVTAQATRNQEAIRALVASSVNPHLPAIAALSKSAAFDASKALTQVTAQMTAQQDTIRAAFATPSITRLNLKVGKAAAEMLRGVDFSGVLGTQKALSALLDGVKLAPVVNTAALDDVIRKVSAIRAPAFAQLHADTFASVSRLASVTASKSLADLLAGIDFAAVLDQMPDLVSEADLAPASGNELVQAAALAYLFALTMSLLAWFYLSHPDEAHVALEISGMVSIAAAVTKAAAVVVKRED